MTIKSHILVRALFVLMLAIGLMTWAAVNAQEKPTDSTLPDSLETVEQAIEALRQERHTLVTEVRELHPKMRDLERAKRKHEKGLEALDKELTYISNRIQYLRKKAPDHASPPGLVQSFDRVMKGRGEVETERVKVATDLFELQNRKSDIGARLKVLDQEMEALKAQRRALGG